MVRKEDVFEDVALALESWTSVMTDALTKEQQDLRWTENSDAFKKIAGALSAAQIERTDVSAIASECLRGFAISMLTVLDGGGSSAIEGRVRLVNDAGQALGEGLHDDFMRYLFDTGRL